MTARGPGVIARVALPLPARLANAAVLCGCLLAAALPPAARADAAAGQAKAQVCAACHGPMGNSTTPDYPSLAGQSARYLYLELKDFKDGRRSDPRMSPMAANLSREDMQDLADYFAAQTLVPVPYKADSASIDAGRKKAAEVLCTMCHLGGFAGQNEIPRVAGQHYQYIVKQLQDFRSHTRTNDAGNMTSVTRNLSDDDIHNLAAYINNLQ
ncbi:cytochrome c4 [Paraburkholderia sp. MMS20-SJTR3]|uniref:Cytochrome c4 n=1 Tax=Paraburkholderia sejongensis TaxID=2886946 RepID=A0ABS8K553_9BURK|nr:c-type cytochrome [Paraburkholderia sp. MMS20-SJTR3]MCC8397018.1 cytochrome c4 [Paraburkholderia sp. MMS20-SJTR3]